MKDKSNKKKLLIKINQVRL